MDELQKAIDAHLESYLSGANTLDEFKDWLIGATWNVEKTAPPKPLSLPTLSSSCSLKHRADALPEISFTPISARLPSECPSRVSNGFLARVIGDERDLPSPPITHCHPSSVQTQPISSFVTRPTPGKGKW